MAGMGEEQGESEAPDSEAASPDARETTAGESHSFRGMSHLSELQSNSPQKALYERRFNVKNCLGFYRIKCGEKTRPLINKILNYMSNLSS